ncbi:MAG TPA: hypothetical protein VFA50_09090 [Stellaceae bacterium]|nr:hypothetical protein [Stellaceae bacterium]
MAERSPEPSVQEIVVALRDAARRGPSFEGAERNGAANDLAAAPVRPSARTAIAPPAEPLAGAGDDIRVAPRDSESDPRDAEIQRLIRENARLNERVFALLSSAAERQEKHPAALAAAERNLVAREVRDALRAELKPLLLALLHVLERMARESEARASLRFDGPAAAERPYHPAGEASHAFRDAPDERPSPPDEPARESRRPPPREVVTGHDRDFNWILDLIDAVDGRNRTRDSRDFREVKRAPEAPPPTARRLARLLEWLGLVQPARPVRTPAQDAWRRAEFMSDRRPR